MVDWWHEIDLDPDHHWNQMGTRALGGRPWLLIDDARDDELALKARLSAERHDEVFAALAGTESAGAEVLALVGKELQSVGLPVPTRSGLHPLDAAGRAVQEDLCLMRRASQGWVLVAGSVCFPSRWRLADKLGLPQDQVHAPVEGYRRDLAARVDGFFDRLGGRIVWRRNWFVHPDPALFQPDRPVGGDPFVPASACADGLYLRSERQTLRRLPRSGLVLFTIKTQQTALAQPFGSAEWTSSFIRFLTHTSDAIAAHRGMSTEQRRALLESLADPASRGRKSQN